MSDLPHLDARGEAHMVAVGDKARTHRRATAQGYVRVSPGGIDALSSGTGRKGDALAVARVAGIMAAKRTSDLIPLCHPIALSSIQVELRVQGVDQLVFIEATVEAEDRTGVEMEALTAVSVAALTLYDMLKAVDKAMEIGGISLLAKEGGRSGSWHRPVKVVPKSPPTPPPAAAEGLPRSLPPAAVPPVEEAFGPTAPTSAPPAPVRAPSTTPPSPPRRAPTPITPRVLARSEQMFRPTSADPRLAAYLKTQPIERAYMLGDLDPAYAEQCRWFALPNASGAGIDAVVLLYEGLRVPAVLTSGTAEDVQALLHTAVDHLPRSFHTQIRQHHRYALESMFTLNDPTLMHRMGVTRREYVASGSAEGVEVMGHRDTAAIMALYQHYPDNFFDPAQLSTGLYSGVRDGAELVSLAGVHVFSRTWDVAAIGNIVTHTDHRGQGLASRCVRHLLDRLLQEVGHVALNVEAANASAIACYRKFGFTKRYEYLEGIASR